jgi:hypothetical protein
MSSLGRNGSRLVLFHRGGANAFLSFNRDAAPGACGMARQPPGRDGELEYQVKRPGEPHERVVKERKLNVKYCAENAESSVKGPTKSNEDVGASAAVARCARIETWDGFRARIIKPKRDQATVKNRDDDQGK